VWGYGNLQQTITLLERIAHSYSFKAYFANWKQSWYFAKSEDTDKLLEEIGYTDRTTYLQHLPVNKDGCKLKTLFLDLFLDEIEKSVNRLKTRWFLDYVRLNIISYRES
jgi:hypothetical protein